MSLPRPILISVTMNDFQNNQSQSSQHRHLIWHWSSVRCGQLPNHWNDDNASKIWLTEEKLTVFLGGASVTAEYFCISTTYEPGASKIDLTPTNPQLFYYLSFKKRWFLCCSLLGDFVAALWSSLYWFVLFLCFVIEFGESFLALWPPHLG